MITCTRKIEWCSGHRVLGHESKCSNIHGHNYIGYFFATAKDLDSIGRVIDFSEIKRMVKGWIDNNWDHKFLVYEKDTDLSLKLGEIEGTVFVSFNPTVENICYYLLNNVCVELFKETGIEIVKVKVWETGNCYAECTKNK